MSEDLPGAGRDGGLRGSLARLAESLLALVRTRVELAAIEFAEHRERTKDRAVLLAVAAIGFTLGWVALCALVVACFWDTNRLAALLGVALFHLAAGVIALWRFNVRQRTDPPPFAATLAELERDRQWLAEHFRSER